MRIFRLTILLALALAAYAQDRRITPITVARKQALIIGNAAYARAPLKNPANDATAMEGTLRKLGFEVRTLRNLDLPHMEEAIDEFTAGLTSGSLAFFYFSGHGIQVNSTNYLLPVDFVAASEADVKYKAYPASRIQDKMEAGGARLRILVLDACRNNPFRYKRDSSAGLAPMESNAEGTLIAFATGDNNTADDNPIDTNGLYTKYLMPALLTPGLQLREAFQRAKEDVFAASHRSQNPSIYENVVGAYYLVAASPLPTAASAGAPRIDAVSEAWNLIRDSRNPEDFDDFARTFPLSELAATAKLRAAQLRRASTPAVATNALPPRENPLAPNPAGPEASAIADSRWEVHPEWNKSTIPISNSVFVVQFRSDGRLLYNTQPEGRWELNGRNLTMVINDFSHFVGTITGDTITGTMDATYNRKGTWSGSRLR